MFIGWCLQKKQITKNSGIKNHTLITTGAYRYIRHPIYFGTNILLIGAELVAGSYIFIFYCLLFLYDYYSARQEEQLLVQHFGKAYEDYQKKTRMLIPFIF